MANTRKLLLYFALAYGISWLIWAPLWLPAFGITGLPVLPYHHYIGSLGPVLAAFLLRRQTEGPAGVRVLWRGIIRWRVSPRWYAIALGGPILIYLVAGGIEYGNFTLQGFGTNPEFPAMSAPVYFLFNLLTFGLGEETGWRGYALPLLQRRFQAFTATVWLTFGWAFWHAPAFLYRPTYSTMDFSGVVGFFASLFTGAIILTWLYNSTRGSILIVALFHAMIELIFLSEPVTPRMSMYEGVMLTVAAVLIIILAGPKRMAWRERQSV